MSTFSNILTVLSPLDDAERAVGRARRIATPDSEVDLFICEYLESVSARVFLDDATLTNMRENYLARLDKWLHELAKPLREAGVTVTTTVKWEAPRSDCILNRAEELDADLIIKSAHAHPKLERLLLTATDWELIRCASQPLLLAKKGSWAEKPHFVAAVDPGHPDDEAGGLEDRILAIGKGLAGHTGAKLSLFHAYEQLPGTGSYYTAAVPSSTVGVPVITPAIEAQVEKANRELESRKRRMVADLAESFGLPEGEVFVRPGDPTAQLEKLVEERQIDLVITGAISRSRVKRLFIGGSAESFLDALDCDILVVKPEGFTTD